MLQGELYGAAREDGRRRFYTLHDKLCRKDVLMDAWKLVAENKGVAGVDRQTIEGIIGYGLERFIDELAQELADGTYTVGQVLRVYIPKPNGKQRPLGIPTVRDRIVQQAVKLLIEPIFEPDFQDFSYGYRPNRSAEQASKEIVQYINFGLTQVVDVDIEGFFDHISHGKLIGFVMERIADGYIIKLIREWLRVAA